MNKNFLFLAGALLIVAVGAVVAQESSRAPRPPSRSRQRSLQPRITWSQPSLTLTLSRGESKTLALRFRSNRELQNVLLEPEPRIAPFLSFSPSALARVSAGSLQTVELTVAVPPGAVLGTYKGAVRVRTGMTTLSPSLGISFNVWEQFTNPLQTYSVAYPPELTPYQLGKYKTVFSSQDLGLDGDVIGPIEVFLLPTSLDDELAHLRSIVVLDYDEHDLLVQGVPAKRVTGLLSPNVFGWGNRRHGFVLFRHGGQTYKLQYNVEDPEVLSAFDHMLQSFRFLP